MLAKILSSTVMILTVFLLSACGYHLRGALELPSDMKAVYLEGASPSLVAQFKKELEPSNVQIVDSREAAGTIITIISEENLKRPLSLGSAGRANQYGLEYRLNYQVTNAKGGVLKGSQPIEIRREYFNNQQAILAKDNEELVVLKEMYQQAVHTIMTQIRFALK